MKSDSKVTVIVDNFYVVPIDMKTTFIRTRLPIFLLETVIILIFFGFTDNSQCSQYSERMERAFSSPSAD